MGKYSLIFIDIWEKYFPNFLLLFYNFMHLKQLLTFSFFLRLVQMLVLSNKEGWEEANSENLTRRQFLSNPSTRLLLWSEGKNDFEFLDPGFPFKFKCSITLSEVFKYHSKFKSAMLFVGERKIRSTEKINYEPFLILFLPPGLALPVWQMVNFFISPLNLRLEVNEFPQVVAVHILGVRGPHLDLGDWDQDLEIRMMITSNIQLFNNRCRYLIPDDLNLSCWWLAWASLGRKNKLSLKWLI